MCQWSVVTFAFANTWPQLRENVLGEVEEGRAVPCPVLVTGDIQVGVDHLMLHCWYMNTPHDTTQKSALRADLDGKEDGYQESVGDIRLGAVL